MSNVNNALNAPLPKPLRTQLENTVKAARDVAEKAGKAALTQLAVSEARAPDYLSADQKSLRRHLRSHGRALGDVKHKDETQELKHLVWEVAYEHWHRMLFARFLAENNLLMWEPGAAVSLDDCRDMVDNHPDMAMGAKSHWELAGKLAARMLPQVFKPHSPVFEISFAPEHQRELERLLSTLPPEVFQASDSLGWVYQFWQAKRKDEVNASEVKIGADELPAVTQLFTEPYMVDFLLHNSLGAWWCTRHPGQPCPVAMPYLRTLEDGSPAAGNFEGWPDHLTDFKLLDPSCGSGHFLVAAFLLLVPLRMADESLSALDAVDAVLAHNLHGLEIDPRCVEIAVFALALAAWRYPDEDGNPLGVRPDMPAPHIACCGLKVAGSTQDWEALVPTELANAAHLREGLSRLHATFARAPLLGSLLDPSKANKGDLFAADYALLGDLLQQALAAETQTTLLGVAGIENHWEMALSAQGLMHAALLLEQRYQMVVTNVPYLSFKKMGANLKDFILSNYPDSKGDLANVFLERCIQLTDVGGVSFVVMTQNWLFLSSYTKQRKSLLSECRWRMLTKLGGGAEAFENGPGNITNICMFGIEKMVPKGDEEFFVLDVGDIKVPSEKAKNLPHLEGVAYSQRAQLLNPDARIVDGTSNENLLDKYAVCPRGVVTGDGERWTRNFWEFGLLTADWKWFQGSIGGMSDFSGRRMVIDWSYQGLGMLRPGKENVALNKWGVSVSLIGVLPVTLYSGDFYDQTTASIVPIDNDVLEATYAYCSSPIFYENIRKIDQKLNVTPATLLKVPFDLAHWQQVAAERYPNGLPKPFSDDPTQWLFHGHPVPATDPLQVAVARLLGYVWPAEIDASMELSDEAQTWINRSKLLARHVDDDGIVCLQPVRGERPAHERLMSLLIDAWETVAPGSWTPSVLDKLLAQADCAGKGLAVWLRDSFFEQHAKRFQHRPFIWQVWDGQKDGFSALVNYHKLDAKNLERLIHTYLGDWIRTQEAGVASGADGAPLRLSAAHNLKARLQAILEGEAPYDIFVRWKPLAQQPIGWQPDLNDGVRLNIRPFMTAEVLRINKKPKLNVTWDKDRGKDVETAPWFHKFNGERINDHHLSLAEKQAARKN